MCSCLYTALLALTKKEDKHATSTESYRKVCKEQADYVRDVLGIVTPESIQMAKDNYCLVKGVIGVHVLDLIEDLNKKRGNKGRFKKEAMFRKVVDDEVHHDGTRQMFNCALDWVMYFLIAVPVTLALFKHGLLHMVGCLEEMRAASIVTYIVSPKKGGDAMTRHQAWHEDFASYLASFFGTQFGISVLVGCVEGSEVHIIPESFGGDDPVVDKKIADGKYTVIKLERGEALVMGPGLVHRGVGYTVRNSRLFLAFLGGASKTASFLNTYNVFNINTGRRERKRKST